MGIRNWLSGFGRWLVKASGEQVWTSVSRINAFDQSYIADVKPTELLKRYTSWVYACVNRNAISCSQVPLRIYARRGESTEQMAKRYPMWNWKRVSKNQVRSLRKSHAKFFYDDEQYEEIVNHPALEIIEKANGQMNGQNLIYLIAASLDVTGEAYWLKVRSKGVITEIWPLFTQEISIIADKTKLKIDHYKYGQGRDAIRLKVDDVVFWKYMSLTDPIHGMSPLSAAACAADLYINANSYELAKFKNGGLPDVQLVFPDEASINKPERERIESDYYRKYKGSSNAGKLFIASGGAKLEPVSISPREMAMLQGRKWTLEEICGIYGVPMSKLLIQDTSRANASQGEQDYMNQTIRPRLDSITSKLNESFAPEYGEELYFAFDDPTPVDQEMRLKQIQAYIQTGYSTVNEQREWDGLDPVEWGDEQPNKPEPLPEAMDDSDEGQSPNSAAQKPEKSAIAPRISHPSPTFLPRRLMKLLQDFLSDQANDVISNIKNEQLLKSYTKANPEDVATGAFGDMAYWNKRLQKILQPAWKGIIKYSGQRALNTIDGRKREVLDENSSRTLNAMNKRTGEIAGINLTSQKLVRNAVRDGIANGEGPADIKQRIRSVFEEVIGFEVSGKRAELIARTETIWAHNQGVQEGWKESGVVMGKEWFAADDERMCDWCGAMHGKIVGIEGDFVKKGETFYTTTGKPLKVDYENVEHPPLHPDCRCAILPVLMD